MKVGLVDADIYGFSVPDMMGIDERPGIDGKEIIPVETWSKSYFNGILLKKMHRLFWRGPMLGKMLANFFTEVQWGELDYFLIYHLAQEM